VAIWVKPVERGRWGEVERGRWGEKGGGSVKLIN